MQPLRWNPLTADNQELLGENEMSASAWNQRLSVFWNGKSATIIRDDFSGQIQYWLVVIKETWYLEPKYICFKNENLSVEIFDCRQRKDATSEQM